MPQWWLLNYFNLYFLMILRCMYIFLYMHVCMYMGIKEKEKKGEWRTFACYINDIFFQWCEQPEFGIYLIFNRYVKFWVTYLGQCFITKSFIRLILSNMTHDLFIAIRLYLWFNFTSLYLNIYCWNFVFDSFFKYTWTFNTSMFLYSSCLYAHFHYF